MRQGWVFGHDPWDLGVEVYLREIGKELGRENVQVRWRVILIIRSHRKWSFVSAMEMISGHVGPRPTLIA